MQFNCDCEVHLLNVLQANYLFIYLLKRTCQCTEHADKLI